MAAHDHVRFMEGCFRCDLSRNEVRRAAVEELSARLNQRDRDSLLGAMAVAWEDGFDYCSHNWDGYGPPDRANPYVR